MPGAVDMHDIGEQSANKQWQPVIDALSKQIRQINETWTSEGESYGLS